jgi:hypothetical protein
MFDRYTLDNLRRVLRNPRNVFLELLLLNGWLYRRLPGRDGIDVMSQDWDNLILLDACRYDLFDRFSNLSGDLEAVYSKGTESWGFMQENFVGRKLHDTVYVTANPHAYKIPEKTFFDVVYLLEEEWDETLKTVPPESVANAALDTYEQYPDKRLIVHFMQPHYPFIGERGKEINSGGLEIHLDEEERSNSPSPWFNLLGPFATGTAEMIGAYEENHEVVLPHVQDLVDDLGGRSVVTSDHGNLLGERTIPFPVKGYGHPEGVRHKKLLEVPWLIVEDEQRRKTVTEAPQDTEKVKEEVINERLRNLGYKT